MLGNILDFIGGMMGRSDQKHMHRDNVRMFYDQLRQAQGQFDSQMDESVKRRVKDAQEAGIHPLFALGASVGASPTISAGQLPQSPSGSAMGDALGRIADRLGMTAERRASAKRDEAEAALMDAERRRLSLDMASRGRDALGTPDGSPDSPKLMSGEYDVYKPEVPTQVKPGIRSGPVPELLHVTRPDGRKVTTYNPELGLDEIGQVRYVAEITKMWTTDRIEDIANFIKAKRSAPSNSDVARLERQLEAVRNNPEKVREFEALKKRLAEKLAAAYRRWSKWRKK